MGQADLAYLPTRTKINQPLLGHGRDCLDRLLLNLEEALRFFQAKAVDHGLVGKLCPPDAAEATIATRGSPARLRGFEDTHRKMMIALQMQGEFMAVENIRILNRVVGVIDGVRAGKDFPAAVEIGVTGSAAVGGDMLAAAAESVRNTELTTVLVIVAILLAVYRAPLLVIVPLASIAVSVSVGSSIVALMVASSPR